MNRTGTLRTWKNFLGAHKKQALWVLLGLIVVFCVGRHFLGNKQVQVAAAQTRVQVAKAQYNDNFSAGLDTTTSLRANADVIIKSKVDTYVKKIYLTKGQSFTTGDLLLELDHANQSAQVEAARSQISMNQAAATSAKSTMENAAIEQKRYDILIAKGYTTRQEVASKRTSAKTAQADYDKAVSNIAYAEAQLNSATASLNDYFFKAPFDGVVLDDYNMSVGSKVAPEVSVLRIADIATIKAQINIPEQQLQNIKEGMTANVTCDSLPGQKFTGTIKNINAFIDTDTHTVQADIYIDNAAYNYVLKPGMFARIFVVEKAASKVLVIPSEAIRKDGTVLVVRDHKIVTSKVNTVLSYNKSSAVTGDVKEGELVVISGGNTLKDSDTVTYDESNN